MNVNDTKVQRKLYKNSLPHWNDIDTLYSHFIGNIPETKCSIYIDQTPVDHFTRLSQVYSSKAESNHVEDILELYVDQSV